MVAQSICDDTIMGPADVCTLHSLRATWLYPLTIKAT